MGKAVGIAARLLLLLAAASSLGAQVAQPATSGEHGRVVQSLAGEWRLRLDPRAVGEGEGWFTMQLAGQTMALPGTTDLAGIGYALDPDTMRYPVAFLDSEWPGRAAVARADEAGHLVRRHMYLGKAWHQRSILVPDDWGDRTVELFLERALWGTQVWIDDRFVGSGDRLVAPHRYELSGHRARPTPADGVRGQRTPAPDRDHRPRLRSGDPVPLERDRGAPRAGRSAVPGRNETERAPGFMNNPGPACAVGSAQMAACPALATTCGPQGAPRSSRPRAHGPHVRISGLRC